MLALLTLMFVVIPPILAAKGKLYRGLWFAFAIISFVLSLLFLLTIPQLISQHSHSEQVNPVSIAAAIVWLALATSFGCFLAGCTFRQRNN